ncbi:MAG: hypothetical protein HYZ26_13560 [Chloroflexi bacterium]|nr:hypothetical protein [Chloroflexota bacterium]
MPRLAAEDFITLKYSQDYTHAGIEYILRWLARPGRGPAAPGYDDLRERVAEKAAELAFRRMLEEQDVPYTLLESNDFQEADTFAVSLGGRRCALCATLVSGRKDITRFHQYPARFLGAPALAPAAAHTGQSEQDLLVFAFVTGVVARSQASLGRAIQAGQPLFLASALPHEWSAPAAWRSLGEVALKSEEADEIEVELYGLDGERRFQTCALILPPRQRVSAPAEFYSLAALRASRLPDARLGIHSPAVSGSPKLLGSLDWHNLWVYGMQVTFVGYQTRGEFKRGAGRLRQGNRALGVPRARQDYLSQRVNALLPLPELFDLVHIWEDERRG